MFNTIIIKESKGNYNQILAASPTWITIIGFFRPKLLQKIIGAHFMEPGHGRSFTMMH